MIYIPMGGSLYINVSVYTHSGGLTKIKVYPFTLIGGFILKILTKIIKNKIENMPV